MRDDQAAHVRVGQMVSTPQHQRAPHLKVHVLAVDLRDLFGHQRTGKFLKARHAREQGVHPYLRGGVTDVVARRRGRSGNRAPRAQNHYFLTDHLHTPKNW